MESILLTPENNRFHLHNRDAIRAVRIDRFVLDGDRSFINYPVLSVVVIDETNLVLWEEAIHTFVSTERVNEAIVNRVFAVWDGLTIGVNYPATLLERENLSIHLYYTINPEA